MFFVTCVLRAIFRSFRFKFLICFGQKFVNTQGSTDMSMLHCQPHFQISPGFLTKNDFLTAQCSSQLCVNPWFSAYLVNQNSI